MIVYSTKYRIVEARSLEQLKEEVQNWLTAGWKLQGGVSVTLTGIDHVFAVQAMFLMVREEM